MVEPDDKLHPFEQKKIDDQYFIEAQVERHKKQSGEAERANRALGDIARFIQADCDVTGLKDLEYLGSAALHIFRAPSLDMIMQVCQVSSLGPVHEDTASKALEQLKAEMKEFYGRRRVKRTRSGV